MADQADGAVVIAQLKVAFLMDGDAILLQMAWRTPPTDCPQLVCYEFVRNNINFSCLSAFLFV